MPRVTINMLPGRTLDQKRKAARRITDALIEECGAAPEAVTIVFQEMSKEDYAKAGVMACDE